MPQHDSLSDSVLTTVHLAGRSASAVANGTTVDMKGWDAVRFVISLGTFGVNSTFDGLVQTAPDSGFNTVTNVTNSALTQIPAANANAIAIVYSVVADQYRR